MGDSFPKRGSYEYIEEKTKGVFYDPAIGTKEMVDDVFKIVNDQKFCNQNPGNCKKCDSDIICLQIYPK